MTLLNTYDTRQHSLWAVVDLDLADLADNVSVSVLEVPTGTVIVGGFIVVDTADDAGTTSTLSLGDAGSATRYLSAINAKATGKTALTITGLEYTTIVNIRANRNEAGTASTVFAARLFVEYVRIGHADENQGGV